MSETVNIHLEFLENCCNSQKMYPSREPSTVYFNGSLSHTPSHRKVNSASRCQKPNLTEPGIQPEPTRVTTLVIALSDSALTILDSDRSALFDRISHSAVTTSVLRRVRSVGHSVQNNKVQEGTSHYLDLNQRAQGKLLTKMFWSIQKSLFSHTN